MTDIVEKLRNRCIDQPPNASLTCNDIIEAAREIERLRHVIRDQSKQGDDLDFDYSLRGGPNKDFPCNDATVIECAKVECQIAKGCTA